MRKHQCLLFLLSCIIPYLSFANTITLDEAISSGRIVIEALGEGGNSGKSLKIKLTNISKKDVSLVIPAGQIFYSQDSTEQDLIVLREKELLVERKSNRLTKVYGVCTQASYRSPMMSSKFNLGSLASGELLKIAQYISKQRLYNDDASQDAIWAVTDKHRLEQINHMELANFVAETLGKSPPQYAILQNRNTDPGERAYRYSPSVLEGIFKYELSEVKMVHFGLYNEAGEAVHYFYKNKKQLRGFHKFKFYFKIRNLPAGKYTVKLVTNKEETIKGLDVEF